MKTLARETRPAALLCAGIVVAYTLLGLVVFKPDAVYAGDIGVKFIQARALAANRFTSLNLAYPGEFLDPSRDFFPLRSPFLMSIAGTTQAIYSPAAGVLQSLLVAAAGLRGMILGSILSAAVVLVAAMWMAPPAHRITLLVALGLGSPLWFYAISGWEHAPALGLATAGCAVALRSNSRHSSAVAGLLVGAGAILRDEVLLLIPGLVLLVALRVLTSDTSGSARTRSHIVRQVALACVAAALPIVVAALIDVGWFGRPPVAHLRHAIQIIESAADTPSVHSGGIPSHPGFSALERYETVIEYWLLGYGQDLRIIVFCSTLVAVLLMRRLRSRWASIPLLVWLLAVVALAAADAWDVMTAPKWLAGLQRVSPYLVFALLPAPGGERGGWFHRAVIVTTATFLLAALASMNGSGGKALGPRLLLPVLPLLAVAAVARIHTYATSIGRVDRWSGFAGYGLVAIAVLIHVFGTVPAYHKRNRVDGAAMLAVRSASPRVIVADDAFTAQLLFPMYYRKIIFLADTENLGERLGAILAEQNIEEALIVSRRAQPAIRLPPLHLQRVSRVGRMVLQHWSR